MTVFERWFMKRIIKREVRQGYDHALRITLLYAMIREASENEFTEDNVPTLNHFLTERFNFSLRKE
jgi:hypothetical protein